jgi:hypothetical protein
MKHYNATEIAEALARMWVTASKGTDGEWRPNWTSVVHGMRAGGHEHVPSRKTLMRWWDARDRTQDAQRRTIQVKAQAQAAETGATKQVEGMLSVLERRMEVIMEDEASWTHGDLNIVQKTQAFINMGRAFTLLKPLLASANDAKPESGKAKAARFAEAAQRTSGRTK